MGTVRLRLERVGFVLPVPREFDEEPLRPASHRIFPPAEPLRRRRKTRGGCATWRLPMQKSLGRRERTLRQLKTSPCPSETWLLQRDASPGEVEKTLGRQHTTLRQWVVTLRPLDVALDPLDETQNQLETWLDRRGAKLCSSDMSRLQWKKRLVQHQKTLQPLEKSLVQEEKMLHPLETSLWPMDETRRQQKTSLVQEETTHGR
jgi:hypothetical protein